MYINSPLNYTGNKYKLLPQIIPLFPAENTYMRMIDLFSGGGVVGINVANLFHKKVVFNDKNEQVIKFFNYLNQTSLEKILGELSFYTNYYHLSHTSEKGYDFYNVSSNEGLKTINKESYVKLRNDYNQHQFDENILFYLLIIYGFNNQIRFNKRGEFNNSVGKRDFNDRMKKKLFDFYHILQTNQLQFKNQDFRNIQNVTQNDFVYIDPPYRISDASYNGKNKWSLQDDMDLFKYADELDQKGIKFAMSNVFQHKNKENEALIEWSKKYQIKYLNFNYQYSNYRAKYDKQSTIEVFITNYK